MKLKLQDLSFTSKKVPLKVSVYSRGRAGDRLTREVILFVSSDELTGTKVKQLAQAELGIVDPISQLLTDILYFNDLPVTDAQSIAPTLFSRLAYEVYVPAVDEVTVS